MGELFRNIRFPPKAIRQGAIEREGDPLNLFSIASMRFLLRPEIPDKAKAQPLWGRSDGPAKMGLVGLT